MVMASKEPRLVNHILQKFQRSTASIYDVLPKINGPIVTSYCYVILIEKIMQIN